MTMARAFAAAVQIDDNRVGVFGGAIRGGNLSSSEILDLQTGAFSAGPAMAKPRAFVAAAAV